MERIFNVYIVMRQDSFTNRSFAITSEYNYENGDTIQYNCDNWIEIY